MDVTNTLNAPTSLPTNENDIAQNPDAILGKDDFMMLLLTELQYQDPTDPMDSDKILTQTSELASLEAADNTNKALENLTKTLTQTSGLSAISAIGKMASLGSSSIILDEENTPTFELYFADDIQSGSLQITDVNGNTIRTVDLDQMPGGIQTFTWDGTDTNGRRVPPGSYTITANYITPSGETKNTAYGFYPIESVRFDGDKAMLKLGSQYYPMDAIKEIYQS
jgi:flagellar basal-body rod modification protein FlgD